MVELRHSSLPNIHTNSGPSGVLNYFKGLPTYLAIEKSKESTFLSLQLMSNWTNFSIPSYRDKTTPIG